ncbi:CaiB/BaiF CoA transferase family protein [Leekyejoonella antrihumi]|nr:CoA transferase [Leekyejoonella antrihumi]
MPPHTAWTSQTPPLEGVVVLDLSRYIAGPYCTMLMADAGATIIKVEPPAGDDTRGLEPFVPGPSGESVSAYFIRMNRGKKSIVLDLKTASGREELAALVRKADVLVENFAAGVLERLGFPQEHLYEINPSLIYCSVSGFGHSQSPMKHRPAYNIVAEYEAGVFYQKDANAIPAPVGPPVGDMFPALHALSGLLMALYRKAMTGEGGRVDIAMYDSMLSLNEIRSTYALLYGKDWDPSAHPFYAPYGVFPVRDGYICIDVTTPPQWEGFCEAIGSPEIAQRAGLGTGPERVKRFDEVIREPLEQWLSRQTRDEAVDRLSEYRVPAAVIRNPGEALASSQARSREMELEVSGDGVSITTVGNPIKIDNWCGRAHGKAPSLNGDRDWILREILGRTIEVEESRR